MSVWKQTAKLLVLSILSLLILPTVAFAAQSASSNYQVNEVQFGNGGELNASSTSFCSKQSVGDTAVGNTSSANFQAQGGFNTDRTPYLEFTVSNTTIDLGTLTPTSTKTANATFTVKSYLSHGYTVVNASDPPTNNSYTMNALTIPGVSQVGTEQFGINLVANTSPVNFGASPTFSPDNTFAYGQLSSDYAIPNNYKYVKGDAVAFSTQSSSETNYTISYLFNISHVTPGGTYVMHHVLVATALF